MTLSRRRFLALGAGAGMAALGVTGCGSSTSLSGPDDITMWVWNTSVSDKLTARAAHGIPGVPGKRLKLAKIGGNFGTKVRTTLAGKSMVPDIVAVNDGEMAGYFTSADQFHDLGPLGADQVRGEYLEWRMKRATTPDGRLIAFPMDIGPTAHYFRADIFRKAGLPDVPDEVAELASDWDSYLAMGRRLKKAVPGSVVSADLPGAWNNVRSSAKYNFMTPDGKYIGDHDHVREQWEIACRFAKDRLTAAGVGSDQSALLTNGRMSSMIAAAWSESDLKASAPKTAGKWRVCRPPNGGGNNGGSYLAVTRYARDPKAAFAFIRWLQSPDNQMQAYEEMALFPSALSALDSRRLDKPDDFFDGQHATRVFAASAKDVPQAYVSPYDALINGSFNFELANVESGGKSPERAWRDAQHRIERDLTRIGVI